MTIEGVDCISNKIRDQIIKLYTLRNQIVHGEKVIYSIERYGDNSKLNASVAVGLMHLSRFLSNRVYFIGKGLFVNNSI